jgi:hypothetical protein
MQREGRFDDALRWCRRDLWIYPVNAFAENNPEVILAMRGNPEPSTAHIYVAVRINPEYVEGSTQPRLVADTSGKRRGGHDPLRRGDPPQARPRQHACGDEIGAELSRPIAGGGHRVRGRASASSPITLRRVEGSPDCSSREAAETPLAE